MLFIEIFFIYIVCTYSIFIHRIYLTKTTAPVKSLGGFGKVDLIIRKMKIVADNTIPIINSANKENQADDVIFPILEFT